MQDRNESLDALRGFAILTMILSGSIAFGGVLPAWMYHAQVPPPDHKFVPTIPGITWVDLVFPFFLFSMGAAIPLSLARYVREQSSFWTIALVAVRRFVLLTFFALFTFHMRAWVLSSAPATGDYLLSITGFILLFFQLYKVRSEAHKKLFHILKIIAFAIAILLLYFLPFSGKGFLFEKSDIIILVLANMAFFGTLTWWITKNNKLLRVGLLPFIMAIFLGAKEINSWNGALFNFSPVPWMYKFYYLKYLFIIIPGTFAGEWLSDSTRKAMGNKVKSASVLFVITLLSFLLVILNTAFLFERLLILNLFTSTTIAVSIFYLLKKVGKDAGVVTKFFQAGIYLLLSGLFFEAYEGGVKKDTSTYSYYLITSGLAFFMLIGFYGLQLVKLGSTITNYLSLNGRNPMVAYVAGNLLLIPVLQLTGTISVFNSMNTNPWIGFLRGIIFTGIVSVITIFFTRKKWFWRT